MTTDREELIQKVKAIRDDAYLSATYLADEHVGDLMRDILAVFEQAHAPADDEREALDFAIRCAIPTDLDYRPLWKLIRAIRDEVVAAGFRRTVQGEPSDENGTTDD